MCVCFFKNFVSFEVVNQFTTPTACQLLLFLMLLSSAPHYSLFCTSLSTAAGRK
uniref:Uncharacterized protein n=1 Tax=Anguilla anguilla TaxID=7936 RepID=A0A0E9SAB8_ANGAN